MTENSNTDSGALNHGPGSFTHNNADSLPGQVPSSPRDMQSPDHAPDVGQSFEAQTQAQQPVILDKDVFVDGRSAHQPAPQLDMQTTLAHAQEVDRARFQNEQSQTDLAATKGQRTMTEYEYQNPPPKPDPMPKQEFERVRAQTQPTQTQHINRRFTR